MILDEAPMRALSRRFGLAALLPPVRDIALSKWLTRPFARVAIAANLVNVIARKHCAYEADHDPDQKRHAPAPAFAMTVAIPEPSRMPAQRLRSSCRHDERDGARELPGKRQPLYLEFDH
jgi:hypothetical protein